MITVRFSSKRKESGVYCPDKENHLQNRKTFSKTACLEARITNPRLRESYKKERRRCEHLRQ